MREFLCSFLAECFFGKVPKLRRNTNTALKMNPKNYINY